MLVSWIIATIQKLLIRRQAIERLRAFDDHLLSDIGISREQISTVVRDGCVTSNPQAVHHSAPSLKRAFLEFLTSTTALATAMVLLSAL